MFDWVPWWSLGDRGGEVHGERFALDSPAALPVHTLHWADTDWHSVAAYQAPSRRMVWVDEALVYDSQWEPLGRALPPVAGSAAERTLTSRLRGVLERIAHA